MASNKMKQRKGKKAKKARENADKANRETRHANAVELRKRTGVLTAAKLAPETAMNVLKKSTPLMQLIIDAKRGGVGDEEIANRVNASAIDHPDPIKNVKMENPFSLARKFGLEKTLDALRKMAREIRGWNNVFDIDSMLFWEVGEKGRGEQIAQLLDLGADPTAREEAPSPYIYALGYDPEAARAIKQWANEHPEDVECWVDKNQLELEAMGRAGKKIKMKFEGTGQHILSIVDLMCNGEEDGKIADRINLNYENGAYDYTMMGEGENLFTLAKKFGLEKTLDALAVVAKNRRRDGKEIDVDGKLRYAVLDEAVERMLKWIGNGADPTAKVEVSVPSTLRSRWYTPKKVFRSAWKSASATGKGEKFTGAIKAWADENREYVSKHWVGPKLVGIITQEEQKRLNDDFVIATVLGTLKKMQTLYEQGAHINPGGSEITALDRMYRITRRMKQSEGEHAKEMFQKYAWLIENGAKHSDWYYYEYVKEQKI